mmetsp:Transcript_14424/g.20584  ORF Transcript_14424/g.20584 Transcript_14424/m.20584 type:complete len:89 (+) Transcript_14424:717-983(+)
MRYYWLRDQKEQDKFDFYWDRSENNHADYWTKHFTALYHRFNRAQYVLDKKVYSTEKRNFQPQLQGCVSPGDMCPVDADVRRISGFHD